MYRSHHVSYDTSLLHEYVYFETSLLRAQQQIDAFREKFADSFSYRCLFLPLLDSVS